MIINAMRHADGDGASFVEAHPDPDVFRLRLGVALNYNFYEDHNETIAQRSSPRNGVYSVHCHAYSAGILA